MQQVLRCWERQSDGSEMNTRKPFGGRGSAPHPAEGAYSAPANPIVGGEGLAVPSSRTPPHSKITCSRTYRRSRLLSSSEGILIRDVYDWGCVSLQYASGMSKHNVSSQYRFIRPTYIDGSGFDLKPQCVVDMENKRIILDRCVLVEIWQRYNVGLCTSTGASTAGGWGGCIPPIILARGIQCLSSPPAAVAIGFNDLHL